MFTPFAFIKPSEGITIIYQIRLSDPGEDSAVCALEPTRTTLFTTDINFNINSIIYTDFNLTNPFRGGKGLYYSVYDKDGSPYDIYIQIDDLGTIKENGSCVI
jgi:hypothetical protein